MTNTHLTILESSSQRYASETLFRLPFVGSTGCVEAWRSITYQQFHRDVELFARHWTRVFKHERLPRRSVIGMWCAVSNFILYTYLIFFRVSGFTYADVLHIYGISRAGYIPQLFSIRLPNPTVIYELLHKADARAIIYDPSFESILNDCPIPSYCAFQSEQIEFVQENLPSIWDIHEDDIAFYFHTSGSTSGSPKLVPMSYRWLNSVVVKSGYISAPQNPGRQDVTVSM